MLRRAVTSLRACPGSARHPFIASWTSICPFRSSFGKGLRPPGGSRHHRDYDQKSEARPGLAGWAGDGDDDHHADVRQGLGAASGLRSRGRPPPGWSWPPVGAEGRDPEVAAVGIAAGPGPRASSSASSPNTTTGSETYRPRGQRPEGDATGPGAGGKDPNPALPEPSPPPRLQPARPPGPHQKPRFASQDLHPGPGLWCGSQRVLGPRAPDFTHQHFLLHQLFAPQIVYFTT